MIYKLTHGDFRDVAPEAPKYTTLITDPIWPNHTKVFDCQDSSKLLRDALESFPHIRRAIIILGGDSDPRWLFSSVPEHLPFLKTQFLEFCVPVRKGRNLYTHLMAYCFGAWPKSKPGARVIPSKCLSREAEKRLTWHPTPLRVTHCKWLVKWWTEDGVIDPFAGSGSIGVACKQLRIPYWGCEINGAYAIKASQRIAIKPEPWC